jgi:hypothetical protein
MFKIHKSRGIFDQLSDYQLLVALLRQVINKLWSAGRCVTQDLAKGGGEIAFVSVLLVQQVFVLCKHVLTGSRAHPPFYSVGTGAPSWG